MLFLSLLFLFVALLVLLNVTMIHIIFFITIVIIYIIYPTTLLQKLRPLYSPLQPTTPDSQKLRRLVEGMTSLSFGQTPGWTVSDSLQISQYRLGGPFFELRGLSVSGLGLYFLV